MREQSYELGYAAGYETAMKWMKDQKHEEISSLQLDLLIILSRIYQARDLITMIDPLAARIVTDDAPRLCRQLTDEAFDYLNRTDLDTGMVEWVAEQRYRMPS